MKLHKVFPILLVLGLGTLLPVQVLGDDFDSLESTEDPTTALPEVKSGHGIHDQEAGPRSAGGSNVAGYKQPCTGGRLCDPNRNTFCDPTTGACECQIAILSNGTQVRAVYNERHDKCFEVSSVACQVDEQCQASVRGVHSGCSTTTATCECHPAPVQLIGGACILGKVIGENCLSDQECERIPGPTRCLGLENRQPEGVCACADDHYWDDHELECLSFGILGAECRRETQCRHTNALGDLARCHEGTCACWDTAGAGAQATGYFEAKCYYRRELNETCRLREECGAGTHRDVDCLPHPAYHNEKVCQCPELKRCGMKPDSGSLATSGPLTFILAGMAVLLRKSYY